MAKVSFSACNRHLKSGSDLEVSIKCADNLFVKSKESQLWEVDFFRMAIQKIKYTHNGVEDVIELKFIHYPDYLVQVNHFDRQFFLIQKI